MSTAVIASWLLTYLVHSTVFLGSAWLVSRFLGDRRLALQEVLLRTALIGGLLTSSLQIVLGLNPAAGVVSVASANHVTAPSTAVVTTHLLDVGATLPVSRPTSGIFASNAFAAGLLFLWGAGSLVALLALGRSIQDLRRLLQTRCARPVGQIVERLAIAMGLRRPVRLSTSKAIAVPFATGIRRPEICCPERVRDLAPEHQTGLFAHELAHLARRDPAWQLLYRLGEAIFVLQPLNRVVRRRLEEIAEHLTDERAVACTGNRLGLARCLVVVAHWGHASRIGIPATAFASGPRLDRRVRRLLDASSVEKTAPVWAAPLAASLLIGAALTLPFVAAGPADAEAVTDNPQEQSEKTWSAADEAPPSPPEPPAAPEADGSPSAPPAPPAPPEFDVTAEAPPTPETPPEAETAPEPQKAPETEAAPESMATPEPVTAPKPDVGPLQEAQPAPPRSETTPEERAARRAYERERLTFEKRAKEAERARVRAEEAERHQVERSHAIAHRQAERVREQVVRREEISLIVAERQAAAQVRAVERARQAEVRSAERAHEAEERAREHAVQDARIRAEIDQRRARGEETALRSRESRIEADAETLERAIERLERDRKLAEEHALKLEERARLLAEQTEAEREALEELKRREAEEKK